VELILKRKYDLLVHDNHIVAFTPEQIAAANREDEKE